MRSGQLSHSTPRNRKVCHTFWRLLALLTMANHVFAYDSFDAVKKKFESSEGKLLDRRGVVLHELRVDAKGRRLPWTALGEVSPALKEMILRAEDKRFFNHHGVDWMALFGAMGSRGASTISMQLTDILEKRSSKKKRGFWQKWDQIKKGKELERSWTKNQILEAYFNLLHFRGEYQGILSASRALFSKQPDGINEEEAAILAALIRSPNADWEKVYRRGCALLRKDCNSLRLRVDSLKGKFLYVPRRMVLAPHLARQLLSEDVKEVKTTLDANLQRFVVETLRAQVNLIRAQRVQDAAAVVVDNRTGEVLSYVAGVEDSGSRYVDGVMAERQAGSTLKPFLYGLAFDKKLLTPESHLDDSPLEINVGTSLYRPQNYDKLYRGVVSVRNALGSSLNVPAVKTLMLVGIDPFADKLRDLGFQLDHEGDFYGPSLALGSLDVKLWDLVAAYRMLALEGKWGPISYLGSASANKRVMLESSAKKVSDILSDREARSLTFGLENPLSTRFWTAVKTGTSKDMRDNWCLGYSKAYTVGVWVGNFSGEPMQNVSGISGAAPIWAEIMGYLHRGAKTEVVDERRPRIIPELKTEVATSPKIIYPIADQIVVVDPDIPDANQMLLFEAKASSREKLDWILNDKLIASNANQMKWKPLQGRYRLELRDPAGKSLDQITFQVRASAKLHDEEP